MMRIALNKGVQMAMIFSELEIDVANFFSFRKEALKFTLYN